MKTDEEIIEEMSTCLRAYFGDKLNQIGYNTIDFYTREAITEVRQSERQALLKEIEERIKELEEEVEGLGLILSAVNSGDSEELTITSDAHLSKMIRIDELKSFKEKIN